MADTTDRFTGCQFVAHLQGEVKLSRRGVTMTFLVPYERRESALAMFQVLDRPLVVDITPWEPFGSDDDE